MSSTYPSRSTVTGSVNSAPGWSAAAGQPDYTDLPAGHGTRHSDSACGLVQLGTTQLTHSTICQATGHLARLTESTTRADERTRHNPKYPAHDIGYLLARQLDLRRVEYLGHWQFSSVARMSSEEGLLWPGVVAGSPSSLRAGTAAVGDPTVHRLAPTPRSPRAWRDAGALTVQNGADPAGRWARLALPARIDYTARSRIMERKYGLSTANYYRGSG